MKPIDPTLALTALLYAVSVYAIFRKIFRKDGLVGFFLHVSERESCGDDLILLALSICFSIATFVFLAAALRLDFIQAGWFITMRTQLTALSAFVLALHFLNGRIAKWIARLVRHAR